MNPPDDLSILQQFVKGKLTFAANRNLKVQVAHDTVQLLTKQGELLAVLKTNGKSRAILVRRGVTYWQLLQQVLVENDCMPVGQNDKGLVKYEYHPLPFGYEMQHTESKEFWRYWRRKQNPRNPVKLYLLCSELGALSLM